MTRTFVRPVDWQSYFRCQEPRAVAHVVISTGTRFLVHRPRPLADSELRDKAQRFIAFHRSIAIRRTAP